MELVLTWGTGQLLQIHSVARLHGLGRHDGWVQGLPIKLQHGVLHSQTPHIRSDWVCDAKIRLQSQDLRGLKNKKRYSLSLITLNGKRRGPRTCMKLYVPCIWAMRSWTACFLTTGSGVGAGDGEFTVWGASWDRAWCWRELTTCSHKRTHTPSQHMDYSNRTMAPG